MEENIKLIEHYMEYYSKDYVFRKAVEKLIKEYKKLEDNNMKMALNGGSFAAKHYIEENYIPKSKVREKIESKIAYCRTEELEDNYIGDKHSQYWEMYRELLEKLEQQLLQEGDDK